MRYRYAYQRTGAPLLSWKGGPPFQSRAADARTLGGLGSLADPTIALPLPRPGSPEPIGDAAPGTIGAQLESIPLWVIAVGGYFLHRYLKNKKKR